MTSGSAPSRTARPTWRTSSSPACAARTAPSGSATSRSPRWSWSAGRVPEPGGFRDGMGTALFSPEGRYLGVLCLDTQSAGTMTDAVRELVGLLATPIAAGVDPWGSLATIAGLVEDATAGVVLTPSGEVRQLPGLPGHRLLEAGSGVLAAATAQLNEGGCTPPSSRRCRSRPPRRRATARRPTCGSRCWPRLRTCGASPPRWCWSARRGSCTGSARRSCRCSGCWSPVRQTSGSRWRWASRGAPWKGTSTTCEPSWPAAPARPRSRARCASAFSSLRPFSSAARPEHRTERHPRGAGVRHRLVGRGRSTDSRPAPGRRRSRRGAAGVGRCAAAR